jgi:hypothetical protein
MYFSIPDFEKKERKSPENNKEKKSNGFDHFLTIKLIVFCNNIFLLMKRV